MPGVKGLSGMSQKDVSHIQGQQGSGSGLLCGQGCVSLSSALQELMNEGLQRGRAGGDAVGRETYLI